MHPGSRSLRIRYILHKGNIGMAKCYLVEQRADLAVLITYSMSDRAMAENGRVSRLLGREIADCARGLQSMSRDSQKACVICHVSPRAEL